MFQVEKERGEAGSADAVEGGGAEVAGAQAPKPLGPQDFWTITAKAFTLMFLAEIGDRTQITMIVLSTRHDPVFVCIGAIFGFLIVTAGKPA
jgi:putative Ca2+/H+ antiporter (TMEM165/GDT1 family)